MEAVRLPEEAWKKDLKSNICLLKSYVNRDQKTASNAHHSRNEYLCSHSSQVFENGYRDI